MYQIVKSQKPTPVTALLLFGKLLAWWKRPLLWCDESWCIALKQKDRMGWNKNAPLVFLVFLCFYKTGDIEWFSALQNKSKKQNKIHSSSASYLASRQCVTGTNCHSLVKQNGNTSSFEYAVCVCVCVWCLYPCVRVCFAEMQREHQRREHRLQEAHCCALGTMEEARQHQIRVGYTHTHTHTSSM